MSLSTAIDGDKGRGLRAVERTWSEMQFTIHTDRADREAVNSFLEAVAQYDGEFPLSEYKELRLRKPREVTEMLARDTDSAVVGYIQAAWHPGADDLHGHFGVEIAVAAEWRNEPVAEGLLTEVMPRLGSAPATLWAHREYVAHAAEKRRWALTRRLLRMTVLLPARCSARDRPSLPIETFQRGRDDTAWLRANNLAFAGHPENGCLRQDDLDIRLEQPWFDATGFFLAWDGPEVAGSCWTKVHPGGIGEIYIIGVIPRWAGRGLGRTLVCHGLRHLGELGLERAILYVEAENAGAIRLYESLGFVMEKTIAAYGRPVSNPVNRASQR